MPKQEPKARSVLNLKIAIVAAAAAGAMLAAPQIADACTRILWNNNKLAVVVGRTMDWPESTQPILTLLPRGMSRDGGRAGPQVAVPDNPARWTSRYGSLVTSIYGIGTADGLNERGLGAHMLYLLETDFGPRDRNKPGLQAGLWAQYALDNAATVQEALDVLDKVIAVLALCTTAITCPTDTVLFLISASALVVCAANAFTSCATTAKPRPASPARLASIAALSASRLVCRAIAVISVAT
jgi:penicillin V acylase-like amidase (Ntn superfamily)